MYLYLCMNWLNTGNIAAINGSYAAYIQSINGSYAAYIQSINDSYATNIQSINGDSDQEGPWRQEQALPLQGCQQGLYQGREGLQGLQGWQG